MNNSTRFIFHVSIASVVFGYFIATANAASASGFDAKLLELAGKSSIDCGVVPLGSDTSTAIRCAKAASNDGKAFRVSIQAQGVDSEIWMGAARNAAGKMWTAMSDSDPSGGGHVGAAIHINDCKKIGWKEKYFRCLDPESIP